MREFPVRTQRRAQFIDVTDMVQRAVEEEGAKDGLCVVFVPHTTAGVTINENADPSVQRDILTALDALVPHEGDYEHSEGNSAAHVKMSLMGPSVTVIVENGKLKLGTWQGIYFCEFDGPRERRVWVKTV